mmetsp:Transcript_2698/g.3835  ORF Transcript_2698/g.3835 Transcript_2698/m.3835 type:complete len:221 (+) Transcript_2698:784-1446(+)
MTRLPTTVVSGRRGSLDSRRRCCWHGTASSGPTSRSSRRVPPSMPSRPCSLAIKTLQSICAPFWRLPRIPWCPRSARLQILPLSNSVGTCYGKVVLKMHVPISLHTFISSRKILSTNQIRLYFKLGLRSNTYGLCKCWKAARQVNLGKEKIIRIADTTTWRQQLMRQKGEKLLKKQCGRMSMILHHYQTRRLSQLSPMLEILSVFEIQLLVSSRWRKQFR